MSYFLGIDLGASSLKTCLIDARGQKRAEARAPVPSHHPAPAQTEQNPKDWLAALDAALAALPAADKAEVSAISLSGGAHIGVLCDHDARPLQNAIMWSDQRAVPQAVKLCEERRVENIAGNRPNATWTLPQLIWLAENRPDIIAATEKLFFAKDWLAFQLCGAHVSDASEAVGAMMSDKDGAWHEELVALSGLKPTALPNLVAIGSAISAVTKKAATHFGLPENTPLYQGAIDTSIEWLCAPQSDDMASLKLASAGVLAFTTNTQTHFAPVSFYPHVQDALSYHAAGMSDCMGALEWLRQTFTPQWDMQAFSEAAQNAPQGADGLLFYPYLSGARAPFWDAGLNAELYGLTRAHEAATIARAGFEGVGHVLSAIWHDMTARMGHRPERLHLLGGGAQIDFFCQMLADMMGVTLQRGSEGDCAFATALHAATAHGGFDSHHAAAQAGYTQAGQFVPDSAATASYALSHEKFMSRHLKTGERS